MCVQQTSNTSQTVLCLLTYFHLTNRRSSEAVIPPLHGTVMVSPYKAVTVADPCTVTHKGNVCLAFLKQTVKDKRQTDSSCVTAVRAAGLEPALPKLGIWRECSFELSTVTGCLFTASLNVPTGCQKVWDHRNPCNKKSIKVLVGFRLSSDKEKPDVSDHLMWGLWSVVRARGREKSNKICGTYSYDPTVSLPPEGDCG